MQLPYYALIMAGGSGSRLWPLSRQDSPKQVLKLLGERTMFQLAVDRLLPIFAAERIITVTTVDLADQLAAQAPMLPRRNFLAEPQGRGTAPVIGLGALYARHLAGGEAVIACVTADHYIKDAQKFRNVLRAAGEAAERGHIVTLGLHPSFASTGFGYLQQGESLPPAGEFKLYRMIAFKEKPDEATAEEFLADGLHSWNSGMFVWTTGRVADEFARQLPDTAAKLNDVARTFQFVAGRLESLPHQYDDVARTFQFRPGGPESLPDPYDETIGRIWPTVEKQTIDYGIMEGAKDVAVIPVDIGWSDVGSWASLLDILEPDEQGNVVIGGDHLSVDTTGTLISSDRLVATIGLTDLIIVDTDDALLVCPRDRSQEVKKIVEKLQQQKEYRYL